MSESEEELALRFERAEAAVEAGDFRRAGELWESIEGDPASRFNAGNAYRDGGEPALAEHNDRAALELGELDAYLNLALLLMDGDRADEAIVVLERGAGAGDSQSTIQLAMELAGGDPQRAEALAAPFAEPTSVLGAWAMLVLVRARLARDPSDPASEDLLSAAAALPEGWVLVADLLADMGRDREAIDLYAEALDGGVKEAGVPLGNLLLERGDVIGAERAYSRGVELGDNFARHNLGVLLVDQGRTDEGLCAIRTAAEQGDDLAKAWLGDASSATTMRQESGTGRG